MSFLEKISTLDRRWIFLMITLGVWLPLWFSFEMPVKITPDVEAVYDALAAIPDGSTVLCSFEYGPSTMPEVDPMARSVMRYLFGRGHKIVVMCLWPDGAFMSQDVLQDVAVGEFGLEYGVDYVNLGYKAGNEVVIKSIAESFSRTFPVDTRGRNLGDYPIMQGIENLANIDFIFSFSAGYPGTVEWVQYAADPFDKLMSTGCTAVQVTEVVPFVQSGQCKGILGGLSGAAEFELLLVNKGLATGTGTATAAMSAQSVGHMVVILFIVLGNVSYFMERRRQRKY